METTLQYKDMARLFKIGARTGLFPMAVAGPCGGAKSSAYNAGSAVIPKSPAP
jgi:hypothetical protein